MEFRNIIKKRKAVWVAVAVIGFVGGVVSTFLVKYQVLFRSKAGPGPAVVMIVPPDQSKNIGEQGTIEVSLDPGGAQVQAAELVLNYNQNIIQITDITPGAFFSDAAGKPFVIEVKKDLSVPGRIHYALGFPLDSDYSSNRSGVIASITFIGKAAGSSPITFFFDDYNPATPPVSGTTISNNLGADVTNKGIDGKVNISGGARLYFTDLTPPGTQLVNGDFSVKVMVDTGGQSIDAVDARINFDASVLTVTDVDLVKEPPIFASYPVLASNNTLGTVFISGNIGTGSSSSPVSGTSLHLGTIFFKAKQATGGSNITFEYTAGSRNDSNIVLAGTSQTTDPIDILSSVDPLTIITGTTATATPTTAPTAPPIPTATPTGLPTSGPTTTATPTAAPTVLPTVTATPTPQPPGQSMTVRIRLQGRVRPGASNAKTVALIYKTAAGVVSAPINVSTNTNGEFTRSFIPGAYQFLLDTPGYLSRRFGNINIISGNLYLDLINIVLIGGDFDNSGEINEVDYTLGFINNFNTNNATVDLDASGLVNSLDFSIMRSNWNLKDDVLQ